MSPVIIVVVALPTDRCVLQALLSLRKSNQTHREAMPSKTETSSLYFNASARSAPSIWTNSPRRPRARIASRLSAKAEARLQNKRLGPSNSQRLDLTFTFVGAFIIGCGVSLEASAQIGFGPIDVMGSAVANLLDSQFSVGAAVSALVAAVAATTLGRRVSPIALATTAAIITTIAVIAPRIPAATSTVAGLPPFLAGVILIGIGVGAIVAGDVGIGPYEQLTFALCERTGLKSVAWMRSFFELSMLAVGFLLGGSVGVGTAITLFTIGPSVQFGAARLTNLRNRLDRSSPGSFSLQN